MIFAYIVLPIIVALMPVIYSSIGYRKLGGSLTESLYLSIPFWIGLLIGLYEYLTIVIVGGEIALPVSILLVRNLICLGPALIFMAIYYKWYKNKIRELERSGVIHIKKEFSLLAPMNIICSIIALVILLNFLPETLAIPWFAVLVNILVVLSVIASIIVVCYLILSYEGISYETPEGILLITYGVLYVILLIVSFIIGPPGATLVGYPFLAGIAGTALVVIILDIKYLISSEGITRTKALLLIMLIVFSVLSPTLLPLKSKGAVDDSWKSEVPFIINVNASEFPISIDNIRLVDRALARDYALSYRLPKIGNYQLKVGTEYENIGLIAGKPAWVVPVYYTYALTPEINKMVGYLYIHLDTPTFESMRFVNVEMSIAPGLYGRRDLFCFTLRLAPDGIIGEVYLIDPSPVTSSPAWVVLIDRYSKWGVRLPYKVLIVGAEGDYKLYPWRDAVGIVPQVVSGTALESIVLRIGSSIRNGLKDYFAKGFIWIPVSQDIQELLDEEFYHRSHHFLLGDWWGRDFYLAVRTTGGEESVAAWVLINDTIALFDLRFYHGIGGITRGVNTPERAMEAIEGILKGSVPYGAEARYPKLYSVCFNNNTYLIWVALVAQKLPGADKPIGVVWVDASNPRISGFVQYVYGESHNVFMERLYNNIIASYMGWQGGNETILLTAYINGTIIRKGWALLQPNYEYAIIMSVLNTTGELVTVIVLESKVATKQDFYNAVLAKEGDRVEIQARWDIDLQAWVAYTVKLYPQG